MYLLESMVTNPPLHLNTTYQDLVLDIKYALLAR